MADKKSWQEWWAKNSKRVLEDRKQRYLQDKKYRDKLKKASINKWKEKEAERVSLRKVKIKQNLLAIKTIKKQRRSLNIRKVIINGEQIIVKPLATLVKSCGINNPTLKRWIHKNIIPKPTFIDSKGRVWFSDNYIEIVSKIIIELKPKFWSLEDFKKEIQVELQNVKL